MDKVLRDEKAPPATKSAIIMAKAAIYRLDVEKKTNAKLLAQNEEKFAKFAELNTPERGKWIVFLNYWLKSKKNEFDWYEKKGFPESDDDDDDRPPAPKRGKGYRNGVYSSSKYYNKR